MTTIVIEYQNGEAEEIHPTFDQWQVLWKSGIWQGRPIATLTHNGWPIKFRELQPPLKKV